MICLKCNADIGEQSAGRPRKYCTSCKSAIKNQYLADRKKRIALQGFPEARPDKTDVELEAIKAKYSKSENMEQAITKLAGILSDVLVRHDRTK